MAIYDINKIVTDLSNVPEAWIYKHYYEKITKREIHQPFDGRIIKVRSILNRDSIPSLCFFAKEGHYYWKDFSSGIGGNAIKFVAYHYSKFDGPCVGLITKEYEDFLASGQTFEETINYENIQKPEYRVYPDYHTEETLSFYSDFKIDLNILNKFKTRRLPRFEIIKGEGLSVFKEFAFGNFNSKGCYQIYQPRIKDYKYLNIDTSYLIGSEQLEFRRNVCGIISGLKDIEAITAVGLNCEYVAPSSENSMLSKDKMEFLKSNYTFLFTMFDNDNAGKRAMKIYEAAYNIPSVYIPLKVDLAENNRHYPLEKLKYAYTEAIHKKINMT